jgi:hypothetical protein
VIVIIMDDDLGGLECCELKEAEDMILGEVKQTIESNRQAVHSSSRGGGACDKVREPLATAPRSVHPFTSIPCA